jgi:hypothetical protein
MILPSFHLIIKQCRSSLFRTIVIRQLSTTNDLKQQENKTFSQSQTNQIELTTFTQKGTEISFIFF